MRFFEDRAMTYSTSAIEFVRESARLRGHLPQSVPNRKAAEDCLGLSKVGSYVDRANRDLQIQVRILFAGAFVTISLSSYSTLAELAEQVQRLERHGEPRRIDLLLRQRSRGEQP